MPLIGKVNVRLMSEAKEKRLLRRRGGKNGENGEHERIRTINMVAYNASEAQEVLATLAAVRAAIPQAARRFSVIVRLTRDLLDNPAIAAVLRSELALQAHDSEVDYTLVQQARHLLAGLDAMPVMAAQSVEAAPVEAQAAAPVENSGAYIRLDADLGRIAIGLNRGAQLRLWALARHASSAQHGGRGWITVDELRALTDQQRAYTARHFRRLLAAGADTFWDIDPHSGRVYLRGVSRVAALLVCEALTDSDSLIAQAGPGLTALDRAALERKAKQRRALVATNAPGGMKDIYIPASGTLEQFEAYVYAGWHAARQAPAIARATLEALFNRTGETLARWEKTRLAGVVDVIEGRAQVDARDTIDDVMGQQLIAVPDGARVYRDSAGALLLRWQTPNTYRSTIKQHGHKGQQRKVRGAAFSLVVGQPPDVMAGGQSVNRLYFENRKRLQRILRKHGTDTPRLYFLGQDGRARHVWEPTTTGYTRTRLNDRWAVA